jgi:uncharacterized protein (DUF1778 family)
MSDKSGRNPLSDVVKLSERASLRVLELLEHRPEPTPALRRAFRRHA